VAYAAWGEALEEEVLAYDLSGGQVPVEAAEAGCAEFAAHRAAYLAGDAAGDSVLVGEEDAFIDLGVSVVDEQFVDAIRRMAVVGYLEGLDGEFVG